MRRFGGAVLFACVGCASACQLIFGIEDKRIGSERDASAASGGMGEAGADAPSGGSAGASDADAFVDCVLSKSFGDASNQELHGLVAFRSSGDVALAGAFHGTLDFGAVPPLTASRTGDVFLARLDQNANARWSKRLIAAPLPKEPILMAEGVDGRTLLAGTTTGGLTLDDAFVALGDVAGNIFLASVLENGQPEYMKTYGGILDQHVSAIATGVGEIVLAGRFQGLLDFKGVTTQAYLSEYRAFVASLDPTGDGRWLRVFGDCPGLAIHSIVRRQAGTIALAGSYSGVCDLGDGVLLPETDLTWSDCVLIELSNQGVASWAVAMGSTACTGRALAETSVGTLVMAGEIRGESDWLDGGEQDPDVFVVEADSASKPFFATLFPRPGFDRALSVAVGEKSGRIFVSALSESGLLAAELSASGGVPIWTKELGTPTPFSEPGPRLALDDAGNVFVAGTLLRPVDLGLGILTPQGTDLFLAEYQP